MDITGVLFHIQFLYAYIKLILLALHIVYIGSLVAVTAYISFSLGKKKGISIHIREEEIKYEKND